MLYTRNTFLKPSGNLRLTQTEDGGHFYLLATKGLPGSQFIHSFTQEYNRLADQTLKLWDSWASLIAQLVKNLPAMQETQFNSWVRKILWRRERLPTPVSWASLVDQLIKNPSAMWKIWVWSLVWEDPLEEGKATHSSILVWRIPWTVQSYGVTNSWTQLNDFQFRTELSLPGSISSPVFKGILSPLAQFHSHS